MKVLVAGGAGYIGAHTCKVLAESDFEPIAYDNLSTGHRKFVRWGPFVEGDILDFEKLSLTLKKYSIDAVINFAAHSCVGESVEDPHKYYWNNVAGTLSLLKAMLFANCMSIVFSSTCAVYGHCRTFPITEDSETRPITPYGSSKLMVERVLDDYRAAYGLRAIMLRYFNAAGSDGERCVGELRNPETHLIPRAMMALQGHVDRFEVFGDDFPTRDGTAIRDYVHVTDLAEAHVAAVRRLLEGNPGGILNLGTGKGYSVREVLEAIGQATGKKLKIAFGPKRAGDPPILVADASRAFDALGWSPKKSDLQNIIQSSWNWHQVAHPKRI